jgi:hypothetical protein
VLVDITHLEVQPALLDVGSMLVRGEEGLRLCLRRARSCVYGTVSSRARVGQADGTVG